MTGTIEFYYDFGSPNAYLSERILPAIVARNGAMLIHRPVLLGGVFRATNNRSPVEAYADIPAKLAYEQLELRRFVAQHGLDAYRHNPHFPVNTLNLMRGAIAAERLGVDAAYRAAVFAGMWERGLKLDDADVLSSFLAAEGLPAAALLDLAGDPEVKRALIDQTAAAVDRGLFGIPTFFVGDAMFFGKDRLDQVEAAVTAGDAR